MERGEERDGERGERKSTEIISEKCRTRRKGKIKDVRKGSHELLKMGKASSHHM